MFGDFSNKKNKKVSKEEQARRAVKTISTYQFKQPEIIARGKKKTF
ncbi:MAG: hypothetical protein Q7S14_00375 [bacterium]|nr:hypothetical protein [bacterium]